MANLISPKTGDFPAMADHRASFRLRLQLIHLRQQGEGRGPVPVPRAGAENAVEVYAVHLSRASSSCEEDP